MNYAEQIGIDSKAASSLISILSISNIIGRLCFGKLTNQFRSHLLHIYQIAMFLSGVTTSLAYFYTQYSMLVGYVVTYGFLDGSFNGMLTVVILDIVGADDLSQGYGIMLTSVGFPVALGPILIGK